MSQGTPSAGRPSNSLHFVVGEMNGKLDAALAGYASHEPRIVSLERWRWWATGVGGTLVLVVGSVELIGRWIHHG